ncbi:MAG: hypothetical protein ACJ73D_02465 [Pyrinomonadaceae bacterium]
MTSIALNPVLKEVILRVLGVGGVFLFLYLALRGIDLIKRRIRLHTTPLCTWSYSVDEWRRDADVYNLSDVPRGDAEVRVTPTDIWILDDGRPVRKELDAGCKCVTACKYERGIFSLRVRWYVRMPREGKKVMGFHDYRLPVPTGHEGDAESLVKFFRKQMEENPRKVNLVTPQEGGGSIFGEQGF